MISSMPLDLTPTLAPFGWAALGFVMAGLAAVLVEAIRDRRARSRRPVEAPRLAA